MRTYPDDPFFLDNNNLMKMKNVLLTYSRRNVSIGYCQGFNFIVGRLLKIFDKEVFFLIIIGRGFLGIYSNYRKYSSN